MHQRRAAPLALVAVAALCSGASSAAAASSCTGRFRFCDNCARQISVTTRKNTTCVIRYSIINGAIFSQKVTKRGNGVYGTSNSTFGAYQPKPNYVGKDYFEVEVHYQRGSTKFTTTLQADVMVTE